ncbi:PH domain-containing protein [Streptomyces hydrogenans]|uniref:PH domain-containing protein n=1 Tax=Streptomyces hydrogenans TaxID=1873719 RepID=UPI003653380B
MTKSVREKHFLRSAWNWAVFAMGLVFVLMGAGGVSAGDFRQDTVLIVLFLTLGGWISLRAPFMGVRVDSRGVRYRGVLKSTSVPWSEIDAVVVDYVAGGGGLLEAEVPVVKKANGKEMPLLVLAGYTAGQPRVNARVRAQLATIQHARELPTTI